MPYLAAFSKWSCCRKCGFVVKQKISRILLNFTCNYDNEYTYFMFLTINNEVIGDSRCQTMPHIRHCYITSSGVNEPSQSISQTIAQDNTLYIDGLVIIMVMAWFVSRLYVVTRFSDNTIQSLSTYEGCSKRIAYFYLETSNFK